MVFLAGETIRARVTWYIPGTKTKADPDSVDIRIVDPDGTEVLGWSTETKEGTGIYYYLYVIPPGGPAGSWVVYHRATSTAGTTVTKEDFIVELT